MAGEIRNGEERGDVGGGNSGPHGCSSALIVFILDTLVKALSILFWYLVISGIFGFFR